MRTQMQMPAPTPEQIVKFLWDKNRPRDPVTHQDRKDTLRFVTKATTSLPTLTIATRDRVEAEMLARARADENRKGYDQVAAVSPSGLDA